MAEVKLTSMGNDISLADDPVLCKMLSQGTTGAANHTASRTQHHLHNAPPILWIFSKQKPGSRRKRMIS